MLKTMRQTRRDDARSGHDARPATFPLMLAGEGEIVRLRDITGAPSFVRRLMDLGLRAGGRARVVQHNAAGVVLALDGMRLALGPAAARHVQVSLCGACEQNSPEAA